MSSGVFFDVERNIRFSPGTRVHWFEYYRDGIVKDGGYGTIIEIKKTFFNPHTKIEHCAMVVLCDDGKLRDFPNIDLDLFEELE